jgi:hypothetical protein
LDGPLPKWCPAVALFRQDGRHSAVALLLKAALIQVSDYRLLGASGCSQTTLSTFLIYFLCPYVPVQCLKKMVFNFLMGDEVFFYFHFQTVHFKTFECTLDMYTYM